MKSILKISTISNIDDVNSVREAIAKHEGVIACEISLNKQEANIIYDSSAITLDKIISSIEEIGHSLI